ncbi:MAG: cytidylate kinase family protein [Candidatus Aenigmarchaeota archaeon]|nr:cytidylate kinase family protein [Candidatus Aenigmarchaeota archaeon]
MKRVVVISGPPGSGTTITGKRVAQKLGLKFFSVGLYYKGMSKEKNEGKAALDLWKTELGSSTGLHKNIDRLQTELAKRGGILIEGTLSVHFLKDLSKYKIWFDIPLVVRAERTAKRDKISYETALKGIQERQRIERKRWKEIYGFDYFDQKDDADLVISDGNAGIDEIVDKIIAFVEQE